LLGKSEYALIVCDRVTSRRSVHINHDYALPTLTSHSHPEEGRTTRDIGARKSGVGDLGPQAVTSLSSVVGNNIVAHVQAALPKVPREDCGVLLTAWVDLHTTEGRRVPVRALLDQCSTLNFISESLCKTLRTKRQRIDLTISRVTGMERGGVRTRVSLGLSSRDKPVPMISLMAYVLPDITAYTAPRTQPLNMWRHLRGMNWRIRIRQASTRSTC
jgi:hypothetical protein